MTKRKEMLKSVEKVNNSLKSITNNNCVTSCNFCEKFCGNSWCPVITIRNKDRAWDEEKFNDEMFYLSMIPG